ncbi:hypothetical protein SDJN03_10770, partial [Cucurbita argyrosperma subsp. sororia]
MARPLVLKTGLNIILASNIPKNSPMIEVAAEKMLVQKLASLGFIRPKSEGKGHLDNEAINALFTASPFPTWNPTIPLSASFSFSPPSRVYLLQLLSVFLLPIPAYASIPRFRRYPACIYSTVGIAPVGGTDKPYCIA